MCAWTRAAVLIQSHLEHIPRPHYGYGSQANQFARRLFLSSFLLPSYLHASLGHFFFFSEAPKSFDCQHFDLMCQTIADFKERHVLSVLGPALTILFSLFFFVRHPTEGNLYKLEEAASLVYWATSLLSTSAVTKLPPASHVIISISSF